MNTRAGSIARFSYIDAARHDGTKRPFLIHHRDDRDFFEKQVSKGVDQQEALRGDNFARGVPEETLTSHRSSGAGASESQHCARLGSSKHTTSPDSDYHEDSDRMI